VLPRFAQPPHGAPSYPHSVGAGWGHALPSTPLSFTRHVEDVKVGGHNHATCPPPLGAPLRGRESVGLGCRQVIPTLNVSVAHLAHAQSPP
jgi:hypothetical protein